MHTSIGWRRRPWQIARAIILALSVLATLLWASLAISFSNVPWPWARQGLAGAYVIAALAIFMLIRPWRRAVLSYVLLFAAVLIWYYLIPARNDRQWQSDVAHAPTIDVNGDIITVHNVRHFNYRSENDFDERWETRTLDRSKLSSADLIMCYWGPQHICHTIVSFAFDDGQYMCVSIETRKEVREGYSALRGMFRQFELVYVIGDERDLIGLRTNHRGEDVYMYHLNMPPQRLHDIFEDYIRGANHLAANPRWYNAITDSCGIGIIYHTWASQRHRPFRLRYLLNGHWDEYLYKEGNISTAGTFEQVRARSRINDRANAAGTSDDFSIRIREGLPQANAYR